MDMWSRSWNGAAGGRWRCTDVRAKAAIARAVIRACHVFTKLKQVWHRWQVLKELEALTGKPMPPLEVPVVVQRPTHIDSLQEMAPSVVIVPDGEVTEDIHMMLSPHMMACGAAEGLGVFGFEPERVTCEECQEWLETNR